MAAGVKDFSHIEKHHLLSDKHQAYTPQYKEITDRYNFALTQQENVVSLPGHQGRHTKAYHGFILCCLEELNSIANGDSVIFVEGIRLLGEFIQENYWIPYARCK